MKWLVLVTLVLAWSWRQRGVERSTEGGLVRGERTSRGHHYYLGIPYAHTDRQHRFQAPLPARTWSGVYDAVHENIRCPQRIGSRIVVGQEDCLTLNVYTPGHIHDQPLPVMVYFHGGGFYDGSGTAAIYGPDYLIDKGVILVTINYRLNIQGFLCLGIKEAPGNAGLKDQVAGLRWVKQNIRAFGGDPDHVTIFGESAGSASVSYHLLSPMSKGLFHKAILQSGSSLSSWANQYSPIHLASLLAKQMGHDTEDPVELYNIFMNKTDADLVVTRVPRKKGDTIISELIYAPCVEKEIPGVEAFLTEAPIDLLTRGEYNKVPVVIGWNSNEGLIFAGMENDTTMETLSVVDSLPRDLEFTTEKEKNEWAEKLHRLLFGDEVISKKKPLQLSKLHGVPYFEYPIVQEIELILKTNEHPTFNYKFAYNGWLNLGKLTTGMSDLPGATHADDLFYLFKPHLILLPFRYLEGHMIDRMTTLWTNFAKFGEPTPVTSDLLPVKWRPTDRHQPEVFVIDREFSTEPLWNNEALQVWKEIYTKYRRKHH